MSCGRHLGQHSALCSVRARGRKSRPIALVPSRNALITRYLINPKVCCQDEKFHSTYIPTQVSRSIIVIGRFQYSSYIMQSHVSDQRRARRERDSLVHEKLLRKPTYSTSTSGCFDRIDVVYWSLTASFVGNLDITNATRQRKRSQTQANEGTLTGGLECFTHIGAREELDIRHLIYLYIGDD